MLFEAVKLALVAIPVLLPPPAERWFLPNQTVERDVLEQNSVATPRKRAQNLIETLSENERQITETEEILRRMARRRDEINAQKGQLTDDLQFIQDEMTQARQRVERIVRAALIGTPLPLTHFLRSSQSDTEAAAWKKPLIFRALFHRKLYRRLSDWMSGSALETLEMIQRMEETSQEMIALLEVLERDAQGAMAQAELLKLDLTIFRKERRQALQAFLKKEKGLARRIRGLLKETKLRNVRQKPTVRKRQKRLNFLWPIQGSVVVPFGGYRDKHFGVRLFNKGVRIRARGDVPVRAPADGKIIFSGLFEGYGKLMIVRHPNEYYSLFANLGRTLFLAGDKVRKGTTIAHVSEKGDHDQSRLVYFELRRKKKTINPQRWISRKMGR